MSINGELTEGKSVKAGQTLFSIESGGLAEGNLDVRYQEAENNYLLAKAEYERKQSLAADNIVSSSDLQQAKTRYENAKTLYQNLKRNFSSGRQSVGAPISGYLRQLSVRNGDFVHAGQTMVVVSQNRDLFVKADFAVDSFVTHNFWASEACGSFIVLAYNFFSLFRHALVNSPKKSFLKTIRYEFIATPAYFSKSKDKHILYLARSLKTRSALQGIWNSLDHFSLPYRV